MPDPLLTQARIRAAQAGDLEAFGTLVGEYQAELRGFLALLSVPATRRDELAQDVFVAAFRSLAAYDPQQPFSPWLRGIARNLVARTWDEQRRGKRLASLELVSDLLIDHPAAKADEHPDDELLDHLRRCLGRLSERARRLVMARYRDDLDDVGIGQQLTMASSAVRMALSRVRAALRQCVERRLPGAPS